jgi:hypothetical protein
MSKHKTVVKAQPRLSVALSGELLAQEKAIERARKL